MNIRFQPADGSIHFYTGLHVNPWKIPSLEHPTLPNKDLELHFVQIFWSIWAIEPRFDCFTDRAALSQDNQAK